MNLNESSTGSSDIQWCFSQVKGTLDDDVTEGKITPFFVTLVPDLKFISSAFLLTFFLSYSVSLLLKSIVVKR